ncbi:MAG TPA: DEAD/DEAH box helicase family protein [Terriglobales bacterium]|jgi:type III restriction enzyme|nr:DEAD/DEAH box helicase family protein [Terriglobales bacterium]
MPRRKKSADDAPSLLDITAKLRSGACVPALREAVKSWKTGGCQGITDTTRTLLNYWFSADHKLKTGRPFKYHASQQEAIETLIYVWEVERVRTRKELLERYAQNVADLRLPPDDGFARYCTKMATGSGKTKVMALAIAWQYFNAMREQNEIAKDYAKTFLLIAPNVIVLERLKGDFANGKIFRDDPIRPREFEIFWDFDCVMRGDGERAHSEGVLFLTNIQQFYDRPDRSEDEEPDVMTAMLGPKPPAQKSEQAGFAERIARRAGRLLVINDEAHHTHDEGSEWTAVIGKLHQATPITAQLDFSATPRFQKGAIFPWTISDYPLKQAILDGIVKRPVKGIAKIEEPRSEHASVHYRGYLTAAVERWKEYRDQLKPLRRKPVLFIMMNSTEEADDVADWLAKAYPAEFGDGKTQIIHTDKQGNVSKKMLDEARLAVSKVDGEDNPIHAIVSVLMLREGWDVQNVTVVVGLRPYTAKANILPEQAIGRGLRLMFRDLTPDYTERVDIIGNQKFLDFVDDLEKLEELQLDTFEIGKDKLRILTIMPLEERKQFDIGLPLLTPTLVRKKSLAEEIASLDVMAFQTMLLPLTADDPNNKTFRYEGHDIITLQKIVERDYRVPEPQTAQELIGYYARRIAEAVKLPSQFAALAPKVREFFENKAFGRWVDLNDMATVRAMSTQVASYVCIQEFSRVLKQLSIAEQVPELVGPARMLSTCQPFPWSRKVYEATHCVFNMVPCDNDFERAFARFLDNADDIKSFAKLPQPFGFSIDYVDHGMNLRSYYPDFVAVDTSGQHWLIETKGMESAEVSQKDSAAKNWCENASSLTGIAWQYRKVAQKGFEVLQPKRFGDLAALR